MRKHLLMYPLLTALLVLLTIVPISAAQFSPAVFSVDQDVVDGMVSVTRVTSNTPGWIVIHADDGGKPGPVLGQTAVPDGITANIAVAIDTTGVTDTLWAMLHVDEGTVGEYEFPGADVPVTLNDAIVMYPFAVGQVAQSIAGIASTTEGFSTLIQAVEAAGLLETLQNDGPFTLFAPTDDAFAAVPAETLDALLADPEQLAQVLLYHVIPGTVMAADITDGMEAETVQGDVVTFTIDGDNVMINDATVTATDIAAYNGVIHVIDQVILPPAPEEMVEEAAVEAAPTEAPAEEAATEEAATEEMIAAVVASDQDSDGHMVTVDSVTAEQDGWIVIHADNDGAPGAVLGQTRLPAGASTDVIVNLEDQLTETTNLWAMLHIDAGETGVYEFPGPDGPVVIDGNIAMMPFVATVAEMVAAEEMAEPATEEMATEEMAEPAMEGTPSVTVIDQGSTGTNVAVIQAVAAQAGWVVIHADNEGAPGAVLGQASVPAGTTDNIIVTLTEPITGEVGLWAMLHVDEGEVGTYEFPGVDGPVKVNDEIVMLPFTAIVTGAAEAAMVEEPAAEEAMTEEPAAEETMAEEPAAEETMAEEPAAEEAMTEEPAAEEAMAAPEMLPQTGFSATSSTKHLSIVFVLMAVLFGAAIVTQRTKKQ